MSTNFSNPERRTVCEIPRCAEPAIETVTHPQRGPMAACTIHVKNIRAIPADRFPAGGQTL